jgi:hypothetical protein
VGKFQRVLEQIELFIKKYYKNEMIKGLILFLSVLVLTYLVVTGLEYLGRFGSLTRLFLLLFFIVVNGFLFVKYLLIPILKIGKLSKHLSIWEASEMIGRFFPEIGDKLKNTLQLERDSKSSEFNLELVVASIEQRSQNLSVIPFSTAIDLKENRKYLKFLLPLLSVFLLVGILNPSWFFDSSKRVLNFNQEFVEPAPFDFILSSETEVVEGEDYKLVIDLKGNELPNEVKIISTSGTYNLQQDSKTRYSYNFTNLTKGFSFYCEANGFKSKELEIKVLFKPVIEDITLNVVYPRHTGLKPSKFDNTGNLTVPEGSRIDWSIKAKNLTKVDVLFKDSTLSLISSLTENYSFGKKFLESEAYTLVTSSSEINNADSLQYEITVLKDEYPQISVEEVIDSMNSMHRFIEGTISDDYGFRGLTAVMKVIGKDTTYSISKGIKISSGSTNQLFSFFIDLSQFELKAGDRLEYGFTVTDNDEINGFKSSSSGKKVYQIPTLDQLENDLSTDSDQLQKELDQALKDAEKLKEEISELKNELMNKPELDWKDKQNIENLLNMQEQLNNKIEELQTKYEQNNTERENFMEESEELEAKREQLQKLMDELLDEELLELFKELEELMNQMNKDELIQNLEQMEQQSENLNEELNRTLELFKMMEIDQKLESLEQQLRELAQEQEELNQMTEDKNISPEELAAKQEELNKKFEEIQKDMDEIEQKNSELENPMDIEFNQETEQSIQEEMGESKENLENGNRKKSQESQSKSSEMMEQMADDVSAMQMQNSEQQQGEDMDALRYLLENIVALSKLEEALMNELKVTSPTDPRYNELAQQQQDIQMASQVVSDSLVALSKRVFQLSSFITEELADLEYNLDNSLQFTEERKTPEATQSQQYVMTGYNDLALMLAEVLSQMQEQQKSQMPGNGACNKPGGTGQGSAGGKMSMQQMKDALQNQINQMKGGQKPGGEQGKSPDGQGGGQGQGQIPGLSNEQIAKMAAQQGQIRESLKQMREDLNKDGSGAGNGLNELIEEIDQLEKDLLNGNVGADFMQRQQDILTRLLEHEKAMRERGYSDERESNEGKNLENGNLIEFTEYNRKKNAEAEFLRSLPVSLQVYYKTLVNEYFNSVNN